MSFRVSLVRMPLRSPFSDSSHTMRARNALILQLEYGGLEALSECITDEAPSFTGEDNVTALRAIRELFVDQLRAGPPAPGKFLEAVRRLKGHVMAKSAVEMLLWDHVAKSADRPLDLELGDSRGHADAGVAIGLGKDEQVRSLIESAVERGYRRIKVKIEREKAVQRLRRIRDDFPENPAERGCERVLRASEGPRGAEGD